MKSKDLLTLRKEKFSLLEEYEYYMVVENIQRRSKHQVQYKFQALIGIFLQTSVLITGNSLDINKLPTSTLESFALIIGLGISVIVFVLMLLWLDDAISIAGMERFLQDREKSLDTNTTANKKQNSEDPYFLNGWYWYRENNLNPSRLFSFKARIYDTAVFLSFGFPLLLILTSSIVLPDKPTTVSLTVLILSSLLLIISLIIVTFWRYQTKNLYNRKSTPKEPA